MAYFDKNKIGEIRPNQLITTFGPGAIVDAVKDSVTVLDTNYWASKGKKIIIPPAGGHVPSLTCKISLYFGSASKRFLKIVVNEGHRCNHCI